MSKRVLDVNRLPFQIDRTRADSLVRQMTDGLRTDAFRIEPPASEEGRK